MVFYRRGELDVRDSLVTGGVVEIVSESAVIDFFMDLCLDEKTFSFAINF